MFLLISSLFHWNWVSDVRHRSSEGGGEDLPVDVQMHLPQSGLRGVPLQEPRPRETALCNAALEVFWQTFKAHYFILPFSRLLYLFAAITPPSWSGGIRIPGWRRTSIFCTTSTSIWREDTAGVGRFIMIGVGIEEKTICFISVLSTQGISTYLSSHRTKTTADRRTCDFSPTFSTESSDFRWNFIVFSRKCFISQITPTKRDDMELPPRKGDEIPRKISGTAARIARGRAYHHLTLLVDSKADILKAALKSPFRVRYLLSKIVLISVNSGPNWNECLEKRAGCESRLYKGGQGEHFSGGSPKRHHQGLRRRTRGWGVSEQT